MSAALSATQTSLKAAGVLPLTCVNATTDHLPEECAEAKTEAMMEAVHVIEHARQLLAAHGDRAEAEAAQKATEKEAEGKHEEAGTWRRIRSAIHEMRPARVS